MSLIKSLALVAIIFLFSACTQEANYKKIIGSTMGTTYSVVAKVDEQDINQIHQQIETELKDINQLMSTYIPDSEINQFNRLSDTSCFPFSDKTWQVLLAARQVYLETDGVFDITLGPLISRWGFNVEEYEQKVPASVDIEQLLAQVGTDKLQFDLNQQCIRKSLPQMTINLSAIAKGFGVDQLALILDQHQVDSYLVEIGGEVKAKGLKNYNQNWKIAVEKPAIEMAQAQSVVVNLLNTSIATSGDYRNYFEHQGKRFSHTINPETGYPVEHKLTSISVIHPSNMLADAYATALNVMGTKAAFEFAENNKLAIYAIMQEDTGPVTIANKQFQGYISR
ncbi:MAG: FAD:protein FMN transferase [Gammaproteobacteria bacterium]|nr:FAD:protein FMN transferase [Gammaproteobacteria bacterium]